MRSLAARLTGARSVCIKVWSEQCSKLFGVSGLSDEDLQGIAEWNTFYHTTYVNKMLGFDESEEKY